MREERMKRDRYVRVENNYGDDYRKKGKEERHLKGAKKDILFSYMVKVAAATN